MKKITLILTAIFMLFALANPAKALSEQNNVFYEGALQKEIKSNAIGDYYSFKGLLNGIKEVSSKKHNKQLTWDENDFYDFFIRKLFQPLIYVLKNENNPTFEGKKKSIEIFYDTGSEDTLERFGIRFWEGKDRGFPSLKKIWEMWEEVKEDRGYRALAMCEWDYATAIYEQFTKEGVSSLQDIQEELNEAEKEYKRCVDDRVGKTQE